MSLRIGWIVLLATGCRVDGEVEGSVGSRRISARAVDRRAAAQGQTRCRALIGLVREELLRLDWCARNHEADECSARRSGPALEKAVGEALDVSANLDERAVTAGSAFLAERARVDPALPRAVATRRAARDELRARLRRSARRWPVSIPASCGGLWDGAT